MSDIQTTKETKTLQSAIDKVLLEMDNTEPFSDKYVTMVDQLEKLYKIKASEKPDTVSKETLITVGGNLAGIIAILGFERAHIITSKALGFVLKSRI